MSTSSQSHPGVVRGKSNHGNSRIRPPKSMRLPGMATAQRNRAESLPVGTLADSEVLAMLLEEKTADLRQCQENLERCNEEFRQFVTMVSHDLNAPLRAVTGFAGFLKEEYQGQMDSQANEYVDRVVAGATRIRKMLGGLADLSRVETQGTEFQLTDLNESMEQALSQLEGSIESSKADVTYDMLPMIMADPSQMVQLFTHLVGNAIQFSTNESITIRISAKMYETEFVISINDNGAGIDPAFADRVFDMFHRLNCKDECEQTGVGAGLTVCRRIVRRHGGYIWLNSGIAEGCTFSFTMPKP